MERTVVRACVVGFVVVGLGFVALGSEPDIRDAVRADDGGVWIERSSGVAEESGPPVSGARAAGILWHLSDPDSIVASVAVADSTNESWVAQEQNVERLTYLETTGDGSPLWEFDVAPENPSTVAVASAEDSSRGFLLVTGSGGASIRAFAGAGGATPLWTYSFPGTPTSVPTRGIAASRDGSIVAGVAYDSGSGTSTVAIVDGETGAELQRRDFSGLSNGVELSDDGSRAVVTLGATAEIVETAGMTTLFSFTASGAGNVFHRISGDGKTAAAGGFLFRIYREVGGNWSLAYQGSEASQWFGFGMGLSRDGRTAMAASFDYTNYLVLTYRILDVEGGVELARTTTTGTGGFQDTVVDVEVSDDGEVFAVATWGTEDNAHPEVLVFDREANVIGSVDTPGSAFAVDLSGDGQYVLAGGKAVHANTLGRGMDTYAYRVYEPAGVCGRGGVDAGCGVRSDVLFLNGATGGATRTISVATTTPLEFRVDEPPSRRGDGQSTRCCVYAWLGEPGEGDVVAVPKGLGAMCFGPYLTATRPPKKIWNAIGFPSKLGPDNGPGAPPVIPDGGGFVFASLPAGAGQAVVVTFQGIVEDDCSPGSVPYSVTNGMVVRIE
jgi:hypothetical protein